MKTDFLNSILSLFIDEYKNPLVITPTQRQIIEAVAIKKNPRVACICPTQYGKSTAVALGVIIRATSLPEQFVVVGGTKSKAQIIMGYIIDHLFDSPIFQSQLAIDGGSIERLRRERSRDHLTFKRGGEIRILSSEYQNKRKLGEALLGEGGQNIVIDDSPLCDDTQYAYIKRMARGKKDNFIIELGNPLRRNHFYRTMHGEDKRYKRIWIDYKKAMKEGRFTKEDIEEAKKEKLFDVFYECKFPTGIQMDEKGYIHLFTADLLDKATAPSRPLSGRIHLGQDVGQGGAYNVFCLRDDKFADIALRNRDPDIMRQVGLTINFMKEYNIVAPDVAIDDIGVGAGVSSRLKEQKFNVNPVKNGADAKDRRRFINVRAESYWSLMEWIKAGGKIVNDDKLVEQLREIRYRAVDSSGKIAIEPKEQIMLRYGSSPDEADALALTFAQLRAGKVSTGKNEEQEKKPKELNDLDAMKSFYKEQLQEAAL